MKLSRRSFLQSAAGLAAGVTSGLPVFSADSPGAGVLPHRRLGRTGVNVSMLGIGMAPMGSNGTSFDDAEKTVRTALDMGVNYVDVSPDYGNSEDKLKNALKGMRDRVFLVTKVNPSAADRDGVQKQIERSLTRMGVDHIDAVHIHNLGDFDMDHVLTDEGTLGGLKEARRRGLIRFIGTSGHMRPARFIKAIGTGDIDLTMNALNFADRHNYDFEGLVLPVARQHDTAVVAMKVLGGAVNWRYDGVTEATLAAYHARSIRYSLGLPGVCTAVIGLSNPTQVQQAVEVVRAYKPLPETEKTALLGEGAELSKTRGLYFGPVTG